MGSPFGGPPADNMLTSTMGASLGGIPTPINHNGLQGVGDGIASNSNTMASPFGGIPTPKSNDFGTGLGYSNDASIGQSVTSPGGSYESISRPMSNDTGISYEGE